MSPIQFFLGAEPHSNLEGVLRQCAVQPVWMPFDPRAIAFVSKFSQNLLTHSKIRSFPELAALAHWFRAARIRDLSLQQYKPNNAVLRGRGLVFHIAPANVDSVAMYSWLIALLAGNTNLVRISQKSSLQIDLILSVLRKTLDDTDVGHPVANRIVLCTYPHDEAITRIISNAVMCRVVWGGDVTVSAIRAIPLNPNAIELTFSDRFSVSALESKALLNLSDTKLESQAAAFYNDAFWFSQQACSSPRLLVWIGNSSDCYKAQKKFWAAVQEQILIRQSENTAAMSMSRLSTAFNLAANSLAQPIADQDMGSYPMRLELEVAINPEIKKMHGGNGLFLEQRLENLNDLALQMTAKEQTLSVLGFDREELLEFIEKLPPRAIDRIVPFGDALSFSHIWDGIDLFSAFTRQITLPILNK